MAHAGVIYTYAGSQFSQSGSLSDPDNLGIESISVTLDLSDVPSDGTYGNNLSPFSLTIADGFRTFDVDYGSGVNPTFGYIAFQDGQITTWHLEFQFGLGQTADPGALPPPGQFVQQYYCISSDQSCFDPNLPYTDFIPAPVDDFSFYEIEPNNPSATSDSFDYGDTNSEGSWTSSLTAAPEPATLTLLISALVGLVALRNRLKAGHS